MTPLDILWLFFMLSSLQPVLQQRYLAYHVEPSLPLPGEVHPLLCMSRRRADVPSLKQIYTAQEYAGRAVQAIDRRVRAARRKEILAGN